MVKQAKTKKAAEQKVRVPPKKPPQWLGGVEKPSQMTLVEYCKSKGAHPEWAEETERLFRAHYARFVEVCAAEKEATEGENDPKAPPDQSALGKSIGKRVCKAALQLKESGGEPDKVAAQVRDWFAQTREVAVAVDDEDVREAVLGALAEPNA